MKFAEAPQLGKVIGLYSHRAAYVFEDVGTIGEKDVRHYLDIILESALGGRKLLRVPVGQDVAEFFRTGGVPRARTAQEPSHPAPAVIGTCPVCNFPQYESPSGLVCANGHGGA
jgi:hypothetical protein